MGVAGSLGTVLAEAAAVPAVVEASGAALAVAVAAAAAAAVVAVAAVALPERVGLTQGPLVPAGLT